MPQSAAQVFTTLHTHLENFIKKRNRSPEDAEDILQEVFYQFSRVSQAGQIIEQPAAWLFHVARNMIINLHRKNRELQLPSFYDEDEDEYVTEEIADIVFCQESTPENDFLRSLVLDEIQKAVNELPDEQREVFTLTEYYGMPVKEIAANTGVSINTVLSRKHYAVLHLRKALKELYALSGSGSVT